MNLDRCGPGLKTGLHQKTQGETITVYVYTRFALHARDNTPSPPLCTKKSTRLLRELRRISLHVPPSKGNRLGGVSGFSLTQNLLSFKKAPNYF